jgi:hypothetical protein
MYSRKHILISSFSSYRLEVFGKRALRILGLKIDEVTGGWRKLRNEEAHNAFSSANNIRMMKSRRKR